MTIRLTRWDVVDHLKTEEDIALYLEACIEEAGDDAEFIAKAHESVARARVINRIGAGVDSQPVTGASRQESGSRPG
ncbi:probable addiction module antidote protein [Azotobacter beijerinckii]|uniref:Probable addiction module antidote protein n=1 Tax=Azotobacter beijerinckii TaxID=170623 RepID=A0A1H6Z2P3_9GAMM|nr:transcriptional regulator [Azotobacter beijerinckii]SEJ43810.1 probable addiction module antidote protein [Azotobacter beijerinckii]SEJ57656.1 probable addiction module antidote protein [Azotobacter beijerinckii]